MYIPIKFVNKRKFKTFKIGSQNVETIEKIIKRRIALASNLRADQIELDYDLLKHLVKKFGNNKRALLNYLYQQYN